MELKTAIEILEYHQEWRLGKREDMIHEPKKLTEALDTVLLELKQSQENWIKLNKKSTNLPKKNCYCWLRVKDDYGDYHVLTGHYSDGGKHFYANIMATITHYQIIETPIDPIT